MKNSRVAISVLTLIVFLTSCASYKSEPLANLTLETLPLEEAHKDVVVVAKAFDKADCKRYLDRDVIAKGYQPVQLFIQNNTDKNYLFALNRLTLPQARSEEVADKVHTSTVGRAVGYGAAALVLWPFAVPAIVDGMKSASANESLDMDFSTKVARDQVITSHSYFNKIIFVSKEEYQPTFSVTLIEQETREPKVFTVTAH
jgi:hypothetical protein